MKNLNALLLAMVIGLLIVGVGLGFLFGFDNPVPWILLAVLAVIPFVYRRNACGDAILWNDSYSVGIKSIDDDHKKLITLVNKFNCAYKFNSGEDFERESLDELVDYTRYHFNREEQMMQDNDYPDFEAHKAQHVAMVTQVENIVKDYDNRGYEALDGVSDLLKGWLINHINGTDK